jgi:hypothetical protein
MIHKEKRVGEERRGWAKSVVGVWKVLYIEN